MVSMRAARDRKLEAPEKATAPPGSGIVKPCEENLQ
jgi:hypothetical protein